jgi:hypothetical protein
MAFTVTYNGNGSDGGSVPVDATAHNAGDTVTVQPPVVTQFGGGCDDTPSCPFAKTDSTRTAQA